MFVAVDLTNETWLICGGRKFADQAMFDGAMHDLIGMRGCPWRIVHGDATGADTMAGAWGRRMGIDVRPVPAQWQNYKKAAGAIRNQQMLDVYKPKFVVAFPGGNGTADMVKKAKAAGVDVAEIRASEGCKVEAGRVGK